MIKKIINPAIVYLGKKVEKARFSKPPVFIVGCPRSGTTLLLSILSAHPAVFVVKRQTYAFNLWETHGGKAFPLRIDRLYRELLRGKIKKTAVRWCEKTPKHMERLNEIAEFIPGVKVIHLIRDGRDVVTSKHPSYLNRRKYWVSPQKWVDYVKMGLAFSDKHNIINVKYEDITAGKFNEEMGKICGYLGEKPVLKRETWLKHKTLKRSKHLAGPVRQIHSNAVKKWQREEHKERIEEFYRDQEAVELLKKLDYE